MERTTINLPNAGADPFRVFVFGDQSSCSLSNLQLLLLKKDNPYLISFIDQVNYTLRHEVARLKTTERQLFPAFSSIQNLVARGLKKEKNAALESVLATIYQLCCFLNYFGDGQEKYPAGLNDRILGLCIGALAAAAVSSSQSLAELVQAGIDAVRVSLKVGLLVARTAALFGHPESTGTSSWSYVVPDAQIPLALAEKAIASYRDKANIPPLSSPYVSAKGQNSWTVSGPPAIVQEFLKSSQFAETLKFTPIAVHAPYHAPHIFSVKDVEQLLQDVGPVSEQSSGMSFISSSSSCNALNKSKFRDLLYHVVEGILILPLDLQEAAENIQQVLETAGAMGQCSLFPISTSVCPSLKMSFSSAWSKRVAVVDSIMESISAGVDSESFNAAKPGDSKIAIIGMSGRFPEAADVESFWNLLYQGLDVHRRVPEDRYNAELYYDPTGKRKNTSKVMHGCWINEPGLFDAKFFNISPKEAEQSDPGQRLALATAYEALEMAGIVADRTPSTQRDRVGVFYGMTSDDYREVSCGQNVDTYFIPGGNRAFTPGKINYFFKYCGPSVSVDTACSSSLAAIHLACNSIWRNECDMAIAGGTNVMSNPDSFAGLDRGHFLSRKGNCNTFDDEADGYCRADAVGTVVLKRLEDAIAEHDPILGVISGALTNHSADSVSITRPHCGAQEEIFSKLLAESGVHPHQVSYIEMHGTGTQAGDATEMASVLSCFAPSANPGRLPHESLHLGSTKANVGHSESASGVTALIKVLLMMQKNMIPPHCGIKGKINHKFPTDLEARNVHIALTPTEWKRREEFNNIRRTFVNNFSAAGGNTALLVEDFPELRISSSEQDSRTAQVVTISAKSIKSLKGNIEKLRDFVQQQTPTEGFLSKLSYTTTARRMHHPFRVAIPAANCEQLLSALNEEAVRDNHRCSSEAPVAFVFSGQGSQYSAIGQHLLHFATFRDEINSYDSLAQRHGFPSILPLIDGSVDIEDLEPLVVQLGTTCVQMALASLWQSFGMRPVYVIGHSLGHYAALKVAGALTASDTIYLVGMRARLLQDKCRRGSHAMLAIRGSVDQVQSYLNAGIYDVACINGPQDTVVSGCVNDIETLSQKLMDNGVKATRVNVPFAFHSAQVDPVLDELEVIASQVTFHSPRVPIGCPLLGKTFLVGDTSSFDANHIKRHCREAVNFRDILQLAKDDGLISEKTVWIELGPHTVCSAILKANLGQDIMAVPSLMRNRDGWQVLASSLASLYCQGLSITWDEYHRDFEACKEVLQLPAYTWDNKKYWIDYVYDWLLTRGDPPAQITAPVATPTSTFSTASVHRIVDERIDNEKLTVTAECEFSSEQLREVVYGHVVNGNRVCTSSLYTDFGITLGRYILEKYRSDLKDHAVDVQDMVVHKALVHKDGPSMLLRIKVSHDMTNSKAASMSIYSVDIKGNKTVDHAQSRLSFDQPKVWLKNWDNSQYYVERSIEWLKEKADKGLNSRLSSGVIYKLFSSLVDYSNAYKGMQEAIVNTEDYEATALVRFQVEEGNFQCNPMWVDSCGQLAGFLMNGHAKTPKDQVFINHGWQSFRTVRSFSKDKTYRTYVRMRPTEGTLYAGDVYIFDDEGIVGVCGSIMFQGIPRKVLNSAMPPPKSANEPQAHTRPTSTVTAPSTRLVHDTKIEPLKLDAALKSASAASAARDPMHAVRKIVSEEIGIPLDSVQDGLIFTDYGVDSLLSLNISGRLREELELDIGSSVFETCATFADFAVHLGFDTSSSDQSSEQSSVFESISPTSGAVTSSATTPPSRSLRESMSSSLCKDVCAILAEEIGVSPSEIINNANLGELGMDSLMSLTVLGRLREELELELDNDFFIAHPTFSSFSTAFQPELEHEVEPVLPAELKPRLPAELKQYRATSTLLQGNPKSALYTLFLFPDGSGSATSYAPINAVDKDICVYGLNCPWLKSAEKLVQFGLQGLASLYVEEIRRRVPHGPYSVGGWSAGGICAYEAAIQFTREGETVERLILLDSPNPIGLEKLPARLFDFINGLGLFGDGKAPDWLLAHFLAFIDALDEWKPVPWDKALGGKASPPKTYMLWAEDGVCKGTDERPEYRDDDPREMRWLLENRTNFGGNNWDVLLGEKNLSIQRIQDANHFTMLRKGQSTPQEDSGLGQQSDHIPQHEAASEDIEECRAVYQAGGFHPTYIGGIFNNRFRVLNKIGYGRYSTVWLVKDLQAGFTIQLASALDFAHEHNVIHTDIKPDNIFVKFRDHPQIESEYLLEAPIPQQDREESQCRPIPSQSLRPYYFTEADSARLDEFDIALGGWGVSSWTTKHLGQRIQPVAIRSPRSLLKLLGMRLPTGGISALYCLKFIALFECSAAEFHQMDITNFRDT
ncbi:conidial pigment polyketide synthase alb1 [Trichoderma arundinaceum]|uniref:Conidial pigment polyketide synthase alb1 n=1 Tax=Trichoderma arundinaceum TaxID=490622 RepID=A0A395NSL0_TRIAR|nr:conidial pigment polyketide synthase alb1 [Trichoderma arundinaceum]